MRMTLISTFLADKLYWLFLGMLLLNLTQRRHQEQAEKKRFATLYIGVLVFGLYLIAQAIVHYGGADWMLVPGAVVIGAIAYRFRDQVWPFRLRCVRTGQRLTWQEILYDDRNISASAENGWPTDDDRETGDSDDM